MNEWSKLYPQKAYNFICIRRKFYFGSLVENKMFYFIVVVGYYLLLVFLVYFVGVICGFCFVCFEKSNFALVYASVNINV